MAENQGAENRCETTKNERSWPAAFNEGGKSSTIKKKFGSIKFRTWMYFFLLAALTLIVLWLFQILFFKSAYKSMKKQELEKLGSAIAAEYPGEKGNAEYAEFLRKKALNNGINIIIFNTRGSENSCSANDVIFNAEYLSNQFNAGELSDKHLIITNSPHIISEWEAFYENISGSDDVSYIQETSHGTYFVYGKRLNAESSYLYINAPYEPLDSTINVMTDQLILATGVCLILSFVVSYFISEHITKPITEFSRVAQKISEGDYSVRFEGNGYTEIENLADTLNTATVEFGKTEQLRRDFLANVSHDLRTPLTMVRAYAEMIRDISGSDEVKRSQHSQVIIDEADRLTSLVNDILNLSKLQSGTEELVLTEVDLSILSKIVLERFEVFSNDGYVFDFTHEGDTVVMGDLKRLEQVMYNLIGNAVNYTDKEKKTVSISVTGDNGKVRVSVRDYGSGIAPEDLENVWERYYRAGQNKRSVVGSGLGLSIVKSILVAHNAQFGVSSAVGDGTEFWFELDSPENKELLSAPETTEKKKRRKKVN